MTLDRKKLRWNGWGWVNSDFDLGPRAEAVWSWLANELGMRGPDSRPALPLDRIDMPASRLGADVLAALGRAGGSPRVATDKFERAFHARGKSYADLVHLRAGDLRAVPDAVVYPGSADQVLAVVQCAAEHDLAVVPYGGGSSVVGGVTADADGHRAVITIDTTDLDRLLALDEVSLTAEAEAGIYGPQLEGALQARGFTLGHYPQSFEFSTLGGWIAARGAGQQSNRYGRAEDWLVSARLATPAGWWHTESFPASAAGPDLNDLVVGCEGALGIITDATVRIHPVPREKDYRGYLFKDFARGVEAIRALVQQGLPVAMIRLSDPAETRFLSTFSALRKPPGRVRKAADRALELGGWADSRCLMLVGIEGDPRNVASALARNGEIIRNAGGFPLGRGAGKAWYRTRFAMPYLRDPLLDRGIGVDTLETSTRWSNVPTLHRAVMSAISEALALDARGTGARAMVMCHISHVYDDGASLYFTYVFSQAPRGAELEQWRKVKHAASDAIAKNGGTISHHHGVGTDHAAWLPGEKGPLGMALLVALKRELDPKGILNPGKLIGTASAR